ncbi:hypothetical protein BH20ACT24_BH20ACT24_23870 [soil metagenome]
MATATCISLIAMAPVGGAARTPTCFGMPATVVGTEENEFLQGTAGHDVIVALGGAVLGHGCKDRICGGPGRNFLLATHSFAAARAATAPISRGSSPRR